MGDCIYSVACPACGKACWVNNGDVSDLTGIDVEAVACPHCGHEWLLEGCEDWTTLEQASTFKAAKTAGEAAGEKV